MHLLWAMVLALYPLAVHLLITLGWTEAAVGVLVGVSALWCLAILGLRGGAAPVPRAAWRWAGLYALLAAAGVLSLRGDSPLALFAPPVLIYLGVAMLFGFSLRAGRRPLVERFMRLEHESPSPAMLRYARLLTGAWCALFAVLALASLGLAALVLAWAAPLALWSWFVNVLSYALIGALFLAQFAFARTRFAGASRASPWRALRALTRVPLTDPRHPLSPSCPGR